MIFYIFYIFFFNYTMVDFLTIQGNNVLNIVPIIATTKTPGYFMEHSKRSRGTSFMIPKLNLVFYQEMSSSLKVSSLQGEIWLGTMIFPQVFNSPYKKLFQKNKLLHLKNICHSGNPREKREIQYQMTIL
jgi:hypothetical protein